MTIPEPQWTCLLKSVFCLWLFEYTRSPLSVIPQPVTQLLVPLWMVLFAEAKHTGDMLSVKFTGADSFRRHMSLSEIRKSYEGWQWDSLTPRSSSVGLEPDWLWRPRWIFKNLWSLYQNRQKKKVTFKNPSLILLSPFVGEKNRSSLHAVSGCQDPLARNKGPSTPDACEFIYTDLPRPTSWRRILTSNNSVVSHSHAAIWQ